MIKRAVLNLSPGSEVFRVSKPGIDVETAALADMLLDDRIFYDQVVQTGFVVNPGSAGSYKAIIPSPYGLPTPKVLVYPEYGGSIAYPQPAAYVRGVNGYVNLTYQLVYDSGNIEITMGAYSTGIYYVVLRKSI